ncbi:MAG: SDR family oxidoreductase [Immundisolibacteraceae bacterium]|nr:SDR family oxidoreductase [Immundisolibacteraceae bacterium]
MDLQLTQKVVLVTGGTKGIGFAAATTFAEEGAQLIITASTEQSLQLAVSKIEASTGVTPDAYCCDVTSDSAVAKLTDTLTSQYGRIDVLVNNAAGKIPIGDFLNIDSQTWLDGWNQKLQCYVRMVQAVFPIMQKQGGGRIVNVVGTAARSPKASYMAVGMSNAALINFSKSLAERGAEHNILVVGVSPAGVRTERWQRLIQGRADGEGKTRQQLQAEIDATLPLKRMAEPKEIGDVICFMSSPRASYISGSIVTVDGNSTEGVFN